MRKRLISGFDVLWEFADDISRRVVLADVVIAVGERPLQIRTARKRAANLPTPLPNNLRIMTRLWVTGIILSLLVRPQFNRSINREGVRPRTQILPVRPARMLEHTGVRDGLGVRGERVVPGQGYCAFSGSDGIVG